MHQDTRHISKKNTNLKFYELIQHKIQYINCHIYTPSYSWRVSIFLSYHQRNINSFTGSTLTNKIYVIEADQYFHGRNTDRNVISVDLAQTRPSRVSPTNCWGHVHRLHIYSHHQRHAFIQYVLDIPLIIITGVAYKF